MMQATDTRCDDCNKTRHLHCTKNSCNCDCVEDEYWQNARKKYHKEPILMEPSSDQMVSRPPHYNQHPKGIECIYIIEDNPFYNLGTAMKYLWRVSWGSKDNDLQDLEKAKQYIDFEIRRRNNESANRI